MKQIILYASIVFFLSMCKHTNVEPPKTRAGPTDKRDLFVGTYKVISETPNYYFTCSKFDTLDKQTWVRFHNICNLFNMEFNVFLSNGFANQLTGIPSYFIIIDKFHDRWSFGVYGNDSIRNVNRIVNDTFRMYYRLHNTPWHQFDTAYMDKYFLMVAVRDWG